MKKNYCMNPIKFLTEKLDKMRLEDSTVVDRQLYLSDVHT